MKASLIQAVDFLNFVAAAPGMSLLQKCVVDKEDLIVFAIKFVKPEALKRQITKNLGTAPDEHKSNGCTQLKWDLPEGRRIYLYDPSDDTMIVGLQQLQVIGGAA